MYNINVVESNESLPFSEAVEAILTYSESSEQLLKRRCLRRHLLFQYLAEQGVIVAASSNKHVFIERIVNYWRDSESAYHSVR